MTALLEGFNRSSKRIEIMLLRNIVLQNLTSILRDDLYQVFSGSFPFLLSVPVPFPFSSNSTYFNCLLKSAKISELRL